jgi:hypothetical protein
MSDLRLDVREYLEESGNELMSEVSQARRVLHQAVPGGWSIAQIIHHLVRTEQVMYLVWAVVPKFRHFPRLLGAIDRTNVGLWRLMGMRLLNPPMACLRLPTPRRAVTALRCFSGR